MSAKGMVRIELNFATALLCLAIGCISMEVCLAQAEYITPQNVHALGSMPSNSLLALITILSLILTAYLIRLLFGKLLKALDDNAAANTLVAKLLAERPCIRNPKND
jgi:hypothetical protein